MSITRSSPRMTHETTTVVSEICVPLVTIVNCKWRVRTGDGLWMYSQVPIAMKRINQIIAEILHLEWTEVLLVSTG